MSHRHEPPNSAIPVVADADSSDHLAAHCHQSTLDSAALLIRKISHSGELRMAVQASSHRTSIRGSHQTCRSPKEVSGAAYAISLHHGFPRLQLTSLLLQKQEPKRSHPLVMKSNQVKSIKGQVVDASSCDPMCICAVERSLRQSTRRQISATRPHLHVITYGFA
jgi:hypothetical protein